MHRNFIIALILLLFHCAAVAQSRYTVVEIDAGGTESGIAINNNGQVVGSVRYDVFGNKERGFIWANGTAIELKSLGNSSFDRAEDVNAQGVAAGVSSKTDGNAAVIWRSPTDVQDLGNLGGLSGLYAHALGINDSGQVIGYSQKTVGGPNLGFLWQNGVMTELPGSPNGPFFPYSINNLGEAAGTALGAGGVYGIFVYRNGVTTQIPSPGGHAANAFMIDDRGWLAVHVFEPSGASTLRRAYLYRDGRFIPQGSLKPDGQAWVRRFNVFGEMVGFSTGADGNERPTLYSGGVAHDVSKWAPEVSFSTEITDINDNGQMVATNWGQAWVLTPNFRVTCSQLTSLPGETITMNWSAPPGRAASDWIGLYKSGDPNSNLIWYTYTGGAQTGTAQIPAPSSAGPYEFRYFLNNGYTDVGLSNAFYVEIPSTFSVSTPTSPINARQPITVNWTAPAGRPAYDWISVFKLGDDNRQFGSWAYTGGAQSGTVTLTAPPTGGTYELRYLLNDHYTDVVRSAPFTVNTPGYSVTPSVTTIAPGGSLNATWTAPPGSSIYDWVGIVREGEPDNHNFLGSGWFYTGGAESGTKPLTMPSTPGRYVLRYLLIDGYTHVAESAVITVQ